jgi:hypothetical protein
MQATSPAESKDGIKEEPSTPTADPTSPNNKKCTQCSKRGAVKGCSQTACTQCCADDACEKHKRLREQAAWKEQVISGKTWVQSEARMKRSKLLKHGRFREPGFVYQGDTVIIWSLRDYISNPKWREDALRKSNRRRARTTDAMEATDLTQKLSKPRRNRRKRFRRTMESLYKKSLEESSGIASSN